MLRVALLAVIAVLMAAIIVAMPFPASAASKPTLYVLGTGFYTAPSLGAAVPAQTWEKVPPDAVIGDWNKAASSKFKVSYSFCDDLMTPTGSESCARQALSPTGCAGHACDVVYDTVDLNDQVSMPVISQAGMPIVGMDVNSPAALDAKDMFCLTGTLKVVQQGLGGVLKAAGVTKAGVIGYVNADQAQIQDWNLEGLNHQGISVGAKTSVPDVDNDPGPAVSIAVSGGTNGLIPGFGASGTAQAIEYAKNTYPKVELALPSYSLQKSEIGGVPAKDLIGMGVAAWQQPITAMKLPGVADYWKQIGKSTPNSSGFRYFDNSILSWLGTKFILSVASTVHGPFSKASMLKALESANNVNMYGIMPPYTSANRGKDGAAPCSPYYVDVQETMKSFPGAPSPVQVASHPGVFVNPLTGKVVYVDPGFKR